MKSINVALRKESVDRNDSSMKPQPEEGRSLSVRRAWIEMMSLVCLILLSLGVALRKESVDRNFVNIESLRSQINVALRKESVDRNFLPK